MDPRLQAILKDWMALILALPSPQISLCRDYRQVQASPLMLPKSRQSRGILWMICTASSRKSKRRARSRTMPLTWFDYCCSSSIPGWHLNILNTINDHWAAFRSLLFPQKGALSSLLWIRRNQFGYWITETSESSSLQHSKIRKTADGDNWVTL